MKYEVKIRKSVSKKLLDHYKKILSSPSHPWRLASFEAQVINVNDLFNEIFFDLGQNPLQYPRIDESTRIVIKNILPFVLVYQIKDKNVEILAAYKREKFLMELREF